MENLYNYIFEGHEVKDSKFRKAMKEAGLERIHLWQDNGYLWIWSDKDGEDFHDSSFYTNKFKDQSIEDWIHDIKDKIGINESIFDDEDTRAEQITNHITNPFCDVDNEKQLSDIIEQTIVSDIDLMEQIYLDRKYNESKSSHLNYKKSDFKLHKEFTQRQCTLTDKIGSTMKTYKYSICTSIFHNGRYEWGEYNIHFKIAKDSVSIKIPVIEKSKNFNKWIEHVDDVLYKFEKTQKITQNRDGFKQQYLLYNLEY